MRPHAPQLAGSPVTSMHTPPQTRCAPGQTQAPARHKPGAGQTVPHAPQFAASRLTSTQLAPQATSGDAQLVAHMPRVQTWPAAHARPQAPQFAPSAVTSTHLPPQAMVPGRHVQTPSAHAAPGPQTTPQAPQFDGSLSTATHPPPPQSTKAPRQTHFEATQRRPPPHTTPQAPQLAESLVRLTQLWPQTVRGGRQPPTHDPAWQKLALLGQDLPQPPQF
jgi:hypothetical protein